MKIRILFLSLFSFSTIAIQPKTMVVVVNDEQRAILQGVSDVSNYLNHINSKFIIYSLDDVNNFENKFSEGLSSNSDTAKQQVKDRYEKMGKEKMSEIIIQAYRAKMLTLQYRLKKYPAIIFDDEYIVYGEFNLNTALNEYIKIEKVK